MLADNYTTTSPIISIFQFTTVTYFQLEQAGCDDEKELNEKDNGHIEPKYPHLMCCIFILCEMSSFISSSK